MPTQILARRIAAFIACKVLHKSGELDDSLQPIGKEGFKAFEPDWEDFELEEIDEQIVNENAEPRPGTTKRRQYYYKRVSYFQFTTHGKPKSCFFLLIYRSPQHSPNAGPKLAKKFTCTT